MRKFIRNRLRNQAEKMGVKSSRYVKSEFDRLQVKKYGFDNRRKNQAKGTHKYSTWRMRISLFA